MTDMLILKDDLLNRNVLSLRTGGVVATTADIIINPNNLKIVGFYCKDRFEREVKVLLPLDIREIIKKGFVINDYEALAEPDDLVRMQEIMELEFELVGKQVRTEKRKRIGKVIDYAADHSSLYIQKLYVTQYSVRKLGEVLSVDRQDIIEVTDKKIIIRDPLRPIKAAQAAAEQAVAQPAEASLA